MKINKIEKGLTIEQIDNIISQKCDREPIANVNWPEEYPYSPNVEFVALNDGDNIYLKYWVSEQKSLARTLEDMGPVWTDSCVEFFISFDDSGYYNFEFNCIGTALLAFRKVKLEPTSASEEVLQAIERYPSLERVAFEEKSVGEWSLMVKIPKESLFKHTFDTLSGVKATANFYKCGDDLKVPHFISWNRIDVETPNFHLPSFFGDVEFE